MHPIPSLPSLCLSDSTQQSGTAAGSFVNQASTCLDLATTTSLSPPSSTLEKNVVLISFPVRLHGYTSFRVSLLLYGCIIMNRYHSSQLLLAHGWSDHRKVLTAGAAAAGWGRGGLSWWVLQFTELFRAAATWSVRLLSISSSLLWLQETRNSTSW